MRSSTNPNDGRGKRHEQREAGERGRVDVRLLEVPSIVCCSASRSALAAGDSFAASSAASAACQSRSNRFSRAIRFGDSGSGGGASCPRIPRTRPPAR